MKKTSFESGVNKDSLEANIREIGKRIEAYNSHILNHKHLVSGFAAVIMALIFLGMLITAAELILWGLCGVLIVALIIVMALRDKQAKSLDAEMAKAQAALKEYLKGRRKKK